MNPYLEQPSVWEDFHMAFATQIRESLAAQVRPNFLVTMIEILSPTNKRYGPDREQYLLKRSAIMFSTASIVEIDLLRGGPRLPLNDLPSCDYCITVFRKANAPQVETWPIGLRESLPIIPIPLKGASPDASLDLQMILNRVYDAAGYEDYLYESPPEPPLKGSDLEWAQSLISTSSSIQRSDKD